MNDQSNVYDVAIVGGGPAGMQAALVLSRTRKRIVVFDAPESPRNAASHGVHNFLGLDGLLPSEIRQVAWKQIDRYGSAELRNERVVDIRHGDDANFLVTTDCDDSVTARHVILAFGYHDVYPDVPGFKESWGNNIIPCPFCDGYENRDRIWGIVGSSPEVALRFPLMARNWTSRVKLIVPLNSQLPPTYEAQLHENGIPIHKGEIIEVNHVRGEVESVWLDSGETVEVGTLLWIPPEKPSPLVDNLVENLGVEINEHGYIAVNAMHQTNVDRLWAVGDAQGRRGALDSANSGGFAASFMIHDWYGEPNTR